VALFTPAFDTALGCDAYLVDTDRPARTLSLAGAADSAAVVAGLLDRAVLMGRSVFDVRGLTFAVFAGGEPLSVAVSEPVPEGVVATLRDALAAFAPVEAGAPRPLADTGLAPLLAYEEGRVSFFDSAATRPWRAIAGNRGVRILAATPSHDPDPDVEIRACV